MRPPSQRQVQLTEEEPRRKRHHGLYGYTIRTWVNYREDVRTRASGEFYHPTDTLGDVLGRLLSTFLPFANLVAAVFDVAPEIFRSFFSFLHKAFSQPLVPRRDKK